MSEEERMAQYAESVRSGMALDFIAASNRSADRMNYEPMMTAEQFGKLIESLGKAAQMGEPFDYAIAKVIGRISPHQNRWMATANVARALAEFVREGWHDTRTATGPEPGRPSSHRMNTSGRVATLLTALVYECEMAMGMSGAQPGWALRQLIADDPYARRFVILGMPRIHAELVGA